MAAKATNAVTLLLDAMRHERRPTTPVTLDVHLVERDSTAHPRSSADPQLLEDGPQ
jgi:DNA-binding LacI/PurR family transcriptional regulator